ncbi:uncharacterized protein LOC128550728 [Mercenaria mercenaria]|uniref:uncharacterized protein LOC128550728 n=1 Tax=Mercenaria mercenaria TaxID=6596 RepID=UPI00234F94DA|nr:uncharacterized protein LOC128550728 [Mercenaria mercenaria]
MKIACISAVFLTFVGFFQDGDAAITEWTEPDITGADGTGALTIQETQATSTTITTFAATTDSTHATPTITYALSPAVSPFAVATATGELTITAALDFATDSSYTLEIVFVPIIQYSDISETKLIW